MKTKTMSDRSTEVTNAPVVGISAIAETTAPELLSKEQAASAMVLNSLARRDRNVLIDIFFHEVAVDRVCEKYGLTRQALRLIVFRARIKFQSMRTKSRESL
jgi:predicted RNA-binding protein YlqC (UPF0109 family)